MVFARFYREGPSDQSDGGTGLTSRSLGGSLSARGSIGLFLRRKEGKLLPDSLPFACPLRLFRGLFSTIGRRQAQNETRYSVCQPFRSCREHIR
jgi:hypothetical protein